MSAASAPFALLVIDQLPLFNEAWDTCQLAYRTVERLRHELAQHDERDLPAYGRWLNSTFGRYLSEIRELSLVISQQDELLAGLRERHWARFFGSSCGHYAEDEIGRGAGFSEFSGEAVPERPEDLRGFHEPSEQDDESYYKEDHRYSEEGDAYDDEEGSWYGASETENRFEDYLFRQPGGKGGAYRSRQQDEGAEKSRKRHEYDRPGAKADALHTQERAEELLKARLKDRYRLLVRMLHPDLNETLSPEKKSLWNQVQTAYASKNLEALELLAVLADAYSGMVSKFAGVHQLRCATQEILRSLGPLQKKVDQAHAHRASRFTELTDRKQLHRLIEAEFKSQISGLRQRVKLLDAQIARFSRPTTQPQYALDPHPGDSLESGL
jgi:hypothetical protein